MPATNKFRLGGMTIEKGKTYSGEDVLRLLKLSFENGEKKAQIDTHSIETVAFGDGYRAGYDNGVRDAEIKNADIREFIRLGQILFGGDQQ